MFFSIIVPVYNMEKYMHECIDSIIGQDCEDYELILVDDGSKDESGKICDEYAKVFDRIRVIHKENGGLASARNAGLDEAKGEWILFIDSDDYIEKGTLSFLKKTVQKNPAELYTFNLNKVNENGEVIGRDIHHIENYIEMIKEADKAEFIYEKLLLYKVGWEACVQLFNRELINRNNLRFADNSRVFAEDLLFSLEYYTCIHKVYYICNFLYCYRQIGSSIMHKLKEETIIPRLMVLIEEFCKFCKKQRKKVLIKEFYRVYFSLFDFHIQYKLDSLKDSEIKEVFKQNSDKLNRKMLKKIKEHKAELKYCIDKRKWLEYDI